MGRTDWLRDILEGAARWLDRSLELCPNSSFGFYNRAMIDALLGDGVTAEENSGRAMLLSPYDPLTCMFSGVRAFSHLVRQDYASAVNWAEKVIQEPTAQLHLFEIAAISNELHGTQGRARQLAGTIRQMKPDDSPSEFFESFQFRNEQTVAEIRRALTNLGLT